MCLRIPSILNPFPFWEAPFCQKKVKINVPSNTTRFKTVTLAYRSSCFFILLLGGTRTLNFMSPSFLPKLTYTSLSLSEIEREFSFSPFAQHFNLFSISVDLDFFRGVSLYLNIHSRLSFFPISLFALSLLFLNFKFMDLQQSSPAIPYSRAYLTDSIKFKGTLHSKEFCTLRWKYNKLSYMKESKLFQYFCLAM